MDVSAVPTNTMAVATASKQLQATMETQVAMLRELAERQQQMDKNIRLVLMFVAKK